MRGPWLIEALGEDILDADECIVATVHPSCSHQDGITTDYKPSNARLISAAPDLLEALKEARRWIGDSECSDGLSRDYWTHEYIVAVDRVDSAIAKATGVPT
jgi:hypothetical protein